MIVTRRPRYGCRACEGAVAQAPAPNRPIDGGMATEALIAHVIVSKYADHCPLYRQAQIFARHGIDLDRSTLAHWVGRAAWWLDLLYQRLLDGIIAAPVIFSDDTPLPLLDPGRAGPKPDAYGDMDATSGPGAAVRRPPSPMSTPKGEATRIRCTNCSASGVSSRSMPTCSGAQ